MNLEDLKIDDVVEAKCLRCGKPHTWSVFGVEAAPRVSLNRVPDECKLRWQMVFPQGIERKIGGRL